MNAANVPEKFGYCKNDLGEVGTPMGVGLRDEGGRGYWIEKQ